MYTSFSHSLCLESSIESSKYDLPARELPQNAPSPLSLRPFLPPYLPSKFVIYSQVKNAPGKHVHSLSVIFVQGLSFPPPSPPRYTLKLSPQPHWPLALGLLKVNSLESSVSS